MVKIYSKIFKWVGIVQAFFLNDRLSARNYFNMAAPIFILRFLGDIFSSVLLVNGGGEVWLSLLSNCWLQVLSPVLSLILLVLMFSRCRDIFLGRSIYTISLLLCLIQVSIPFTELLVFLLACTTESAQYSKQKPIKFLDELDEWVEAYFPNRKSSDSK
ncbi:MAG: hypothetical protein VX642_10205 [Bdellovibrionota bacterium]|nr:hypothetical protein [Bdellovibrionota bacterium]